MFKLLIQCVIIVNWTSQRLIAASFIINVSFINLLVQDVMLVTSGKKVSKATPLDAHRP